MSRRLPVLSCTNGISTHAPLTRRDGSIDSSEKRRKERHFYSRASYEARLPYATVREISGAVYFYSRASYEARLFEGDPSRHIAMDDFYSRASYEARLNNSLQLYDKFRIHFYSRASYEARRYVNDIQRPSGRFPLFLLTRLLRGATWYSIVIQLGYIFLLTRLLRGATVTSKQRKTSV